MQIEPEHAEESSCFSQIILLASLSQAPLSESDQDFCSGKNLNRESDVESLQKLWVNIGPCKDYEEKSRALVHLRKSKHQIICCLSEFSGS
ncbi:unnamed protein product [Arabidopsis thaliana]|uniref:(thale cress) hypothetical protein n=1 Tax=Arabidopsis thaliana TaxID=3702 RepID=A0A7G2FIP2_ARATH|nr:unnamed protein product [Arabidopsis thaliana]